MHFFLQLENTFDAINYPDGCREVRVMLLNLSYLVKWTVSYFRYRSSLEYTSAWSTLSRRTLQTLLQGRVVRVLLLQLRLQYLHIL